jgi:hypothetical protein
MKIGTCIEAYMEDTGTPGDAGPFGWQHFAVVEYSDDGVVLLHLPTLQTIEADRKEFDADRRMKVVQHDKLATFRRLIARLSQFERLGMPYDYDATTTTIAVMMLPSSF